MAKTLSQKNFRNFVRNEILTGYRYRPTCELHKCHVCRVQTHLDLSYLPCVNSVLCAIILHYYSFVLACILHFGSNVAY